MSLPDLIPELRPLVVYRWSDDVRIELKFIGLVGDVTAQFSLWRKGEQQALFGCGPRVQTSEDFPFVVGFFQSRKKTNSQYLRGFLLDVFPSGRKLHHLLKIAESNTPMLPAGPSYVPDDVWERRYEIGKEYVLGTSREVPSEPFLGVSPRLRLYQMGWRSPRDRDKWVAVDNYHVGGITAGASSFEQAVDEVSKAYMVAPESRRGEWEQGNVRRGSWVDPSAEEVELYQMLGEKNPLLWDPIWLYGWYLERISS